MQTRERTKRGRVGTLATTVKLRLLLDPIPRKSPGGSVLDRELPQAAAGTRPPGWDLLMVSHGDGQAWDGDSAVERLEVGKAEAGWLGRWRYFNRILPAEISRQGVDVLFSLSGYLSPRLQRSCGTICTINNMLPFTPAMTSEDRLTYRLKLRVQRRFLVSSVKLADAVLLHSDHALRTISSYAGDISAKTRVVLTGVPSDARLDSDDLPPHPNGGRPYCFYLSVIRRYKNHLNLVEAYRRLARAGVDLPELVIAGFPIDTDYLAEILGAIREHGLEEKVRYAGTLAKEELKSWLHHATINVFASGCETNSLVLAEILGAEGVLACSDVAPMPEIVGAAAEFFSPDDPESIAQVLLKLWRNSNRRQELRREAVKRSHQLSWEECGNAIWNAARAARKAFERRQLAN